MDRRFITVLGVSLLFALLVSAVFYQMTARSGTAKKVDTEGPKRCGHHDPPAGCGRDGQAR